MHEPPNGLRYLRWGGDGEAVRLGNMTRRRQLLEIAAESPASGARFVGWRCFTRMLWDGIVCFIFQYSLSENQPLLINQGTLLYKL